MCRRGYQNKQIYDPLFGRCRTDVHKDVMPRQGARGLLMDGTAVESAFALLLTKVTKEGLVPDTSRTTNVREGS
ncbi:hypothetical protein DWW97_06455 [Dorea longicatena]|nr:hypothetical protein DWW97_06455 [Dorea longicatena]